MEETFLLYFAHFFDNNNPELVGVFRTLQDAETTRSTIKLPTSWKGHFLLTVVNFGSFIHNGYFKHPLIKLNNSMENDKN